MYNNITDRGLQRRIKQHIIGKKQTFFAIVQPGFEATARKELEGLDITGISGLDKGGVEFISGLDDCYRVNLCSRTVSRVLMRVGKFRAERFNRLFRKTGEIPWELYLSNDDNIRFSIKCIKSRLFNTKKIESEFTRGISSRLKEYGKIASFNIDDPESESQTIFIRIEKNIVTISIDSTGELLYKRGYKTEVSHAPIRETLAALILLETGIQKYNVLIDPMCGCGTFTLEGAGILSGRYPSLDRCFSFMNWPSYREKACNFLIKSLRKDEKEGSTGKFKIFTSDVLKENVLLTGRNLETAGFADGIVLKKLDFFREKINRAPGDKALVILNPPYGKRITDIDTGKLYRQIGNTLRNDYSDSGYAVISPGIEFEKIMGLPYNKKIKFINGGVKVAVIIRDLYRR